MEILYYSSTGNSLFLAKSIGKEDCKYTSIPKALKEGNLTFEADKIGIVIPCHGMTMPKMVLEFIKKATFKTDYLFMIMVSGGMKGIFFDEALKPLSDKGIKPAYVNYMTMQDNFLPFFDMKKAEKDCNEYLVEANIAMISSDVFHSRTKIYKKHIFYPILKPICALARIYLNGNRDKNFYLKEGCTSCGVCKKVCPNNNITILKDKKTIEYKGNCSTCLSCIHNCPQNVIHHKSEKSDLRFRNKNIELSELFINED